MKSPYKLFQLFTLTLVALFHFAGAQTPPESEVRLLTVGNSFADNACQYLPQLAAAGKKKLVLFSANLGGHSLEQHVGYLQAFEANPEDPKGRAYKDRRNPVTKEKKDFSLKEALAITNWNFVTIQQYSNTSYNSETYEPHAGILIDYIRKNAPRAEILVHQTWAYREDCPLFKNGDLSQPIMYEKLTAAYNKIASQYQLRVIPSGDAFQLARALPRWHFTFPDPKFDYKNPPAGALPDQTGSLNVGWKWNTNNQKQILDLDFKHANSYGCYLIGAVWYEILFNDNVEGNSFVPESISPEDAALLRKIAHEAVAAGKTNKPL